MCVSTIFTSSYFHKFVARARLKSFYSEMRPIVYVHLLLFTFFSLVLSYVFAFLFMFYHQRAGMRVGVFTVHRYKSIDANLTSVAFVWSQDRGKI